MKSFVPALLLVVGVLSTGCLHHRRALAATQRPAVAPTAATAPASVPQPIVTPDTSVAGRVASYNDVGRFVVLSFPVGHVPTIGQSLFLYRNGFKVAAIRITGPQRDENIVADVVSGDAQMGDEVRDQ